MGLYGDRRFAETRSKHHLARANMQHRPNFFRKGLFDETGRKRCEMTVARDGLGTRRHVREGQLTVAASSACPAYGRCRRGKWLRLGYAPRNEKSLHLCKLLIVWRARQDLNPRPPGS